jgi:hypothetical protein
MADRGAILRELLKKHVAIEQELAEATHEAESDASSRIITTENASE